jgi:hypothetical protein
MEELYCTNGRLLCVKLVKTGQCSWFVVCHAMWLLIVENVSRNDIGNWQRKVHVLHSALLSVFLLNEVTSVGRHVAYLVKLSFQNFSAL